MYVATLIEGLVKDDGIAIDQTIGTVTHLANTTTATHTEVAANMVFADGVAVGTGTDTDTAADTCADDATVLTNLVMVNLDKIV